MIWPFRQADVAIGGRERPYLLRWHLIPRNRWLGIYLHKFYRDDDDRALHDHSKDNCSLLLRGAYCELLFESQPQAGRALPRTKFAYRRPWRLYFRRAEIAHRVVLYKDPDGTPLPCWSLFLTWRERRAWGFWCPGGRWIDWKTFQGNRGYEGTDGPGCNA